MLILAFFNNQNQGNNLSIATADQIGRPFLKILKMERVELQMNKYYLTVLAGVLRSTLSKNGY